jgi:hypothetical protein
VTTPTLVHCGYHKCLTVFANRCFKHVLGDRYRNFFGKLDAFYDEYRRLAVSGTSDYLLDLARLGDYRISRFIRDPRDLVVSGYFYHQRGLDPFSTIVSPTPEDWRTAGAIPSAMRQGETYVQLLQRLDQEDGLIAEMEFRAPHFRSMLAWPEEDPRIRLWKYEDILGHEIEVMDEVGAHFEWPDDDAPFSFRASLRREADRWRAKDSLLAWDKHPRDPKPGQWQTLFTPKVRAAFERLHGDLPQRLGYDAC